MGNLEQLWRDVVQARDRSSLFRVATLLQQVRLLLPGVEPLERVAWQARLEEIELNQDELSVASRSARELVQKLARIIRVGEEYTYEEIVLVLTHRLELLLFDGYVHGAFGKETDVALELPRIDSRIAALFAEPANSAHTRSAFAAMGKNWPIFNQYRSEPFMPRV